ncbi:NADH-quinone oxidoreductase subunit C [Streptomyces sp. BBFR102]|uniref:NADH-quinone oxidoreductase subunit C n=1 Tax=Streptomyces sp. BBFR102 TaxID=3448171 RepID=UPI003F52FBD2
MTGWLPHPADTLFGPDARAEESYEVLTVDVPAESWTSALRTARSVLGCTFFDWLSAVDEPGTGFLVSAHLAALAPLRRLLLRTTVPHEVPVLESAVELFAGAAWHERETYEMFGVAFTGHPGLDPLLLPENFEGHPLRKDFVLAARVAKAWPGAKEPGEGPDHGGPKRRQMLPPGVPDPNEWGPLKGTLPAAPARPARRTATADGTRPPRRTRTTTEGSVSQGPAAPATGTTPATTGAPHAPEPSEPPGRPRRNRSASQGSASQQPPLNPPSSESSETVKTPPPSEAPKPSQVPDPADSNTSEPPEAPAPEPPAAQASESPDGSATARPRRNRSAADGSASQQQRPPASSGRSPRAGSSDAPWHHARPAHGPNGDTPGRAPQAPGPDRASGDADSEPGPSTGMTGPDAAEAPAPDDRPPGPARPPRSPEEGVPDDDTPTGGDPA